MTYLREGEMITDPAATIGLVTREVRSGTRGGEPTKIVVGRRTYPTDQADLWDALTNAERIPRWFMPISGDLRVGGRYQLEGNAGGIIERCDAPEHLAVTWEYGPMVSWLDITLAPSADGTVLDLTHEAPVDPDMWDQFGPGAVGVGWDLAFMGLGLHLDSGARVDPDEAATFTFSPAGIEFVRLAATDWADAAARDGDEPGPAHEAAARTLAFYTTAPEPGPED
ncbi:MAG: SRPBCC family protein [Acidimicrobiales bacterium]